MQFSEASYWKVFSLGFAVVVLLYLIFSPGHTDNNDKFFYGVMLDAGSTGSRIHVYKFLVDEKTNSLLLDSEVFRHIEPGLSSYKDNPRTGADALRALMDVAAQTVPKSQQPITPVNLKATAGLRLLPVEKADALLAETRAMLSQYHFYYDKSDAVEIMGGDDEGLFGWVTVNYLRNSLHHSPERTAAVLDLGGGSTQIALSVDPSTAGAGAAMLKQTSVMGQKHHMYVYSHLGYGLMAGRKGLLGLGLSTSDTRRQGKKQLDHPCVHPGTQVHYEYGSERFDVRGSSSASYEKCAAHATELMAHPDGAFGGSRPAPRPGQPVFAMSYYFDRAADVGLISASAVRADLQPLHYSEAARTVCKLPPATVALSYPRVSAEHAPFLCMDLCFISALLEKGFGLHPSTPLVLAKKLEFNGELVETSWSLGASLAEISETRTQLDPST